MKLLVITLAFVGGLFPILLNIFKRKSSTNLIPDSVKDVYDDETYSKWRAYNAEHSTLDFIAGIVSLVVTVGLLATNAFSFIASLFPSGIEIQAVAVVLFEVLVGEIIRIGFSYYSTMVIEEKYGFNKSTIKTFVIDKIRGFILSAMLSLFLVFLMLLLHRWLGNYIIILFTAAMFVFTLAVSFLYPYLSKIGNKFTSLEEGELRTRLMELLTSHGYKVRDIKVMDASKRTTKLNAYFTGFGGTKTIVLYDNLVNAMTTDEICSVFAHELGHGLNKDVLKLQILNTGNMLLMAVAVWISVGALELHTAFGFSEINYGFAYILTSVFISLVQPLSSMLINAFSRKFEYRADRQAVKEGYGESMISSLKKLARENFAELAPTKISVLFEYSHPPLADRISAVEKMLKNQEK